MPQTNPAVAAADGSEWGRAFGKRRARRKKEGTRELGGREKRH